MATKKAETKSGSDLWQIGGAKLSKDSKRVNISLIRSKDDVKEFGTISIDIAKGTKVTRVKVNDHEICIAIARKDIGTNDDIEV